MKAITTYMCDHCLCKFDRPCEDHEVECSKEKRRVGRVKQLLSLLYCDEFDDAIGARINGVTFLLPNPPTKNAISAIGDATELVSTASHPSSHDADLIKGANSILAA